MSRTAPARGASWSPSSSSPRDQHRERAGGSRSGSAIVPARRERRARPGRSWCRPRARSGRAAGPRRPCARPGPARGTPSAWTLASRAGVFPPRAGPRRRPPAASPPVDIAIASPSSSAAAAGCPARDSPTSRSVTGLAGPAPARSGARTAKPSIAELSKAGTGWLGRRRPRRAPGRARPRRARRTRRPADAGRGEDRLRGVLDLDERAPRHCPVDATLGRG